MMKPVVSKDFNLEDIRKIREYNSLRHIQMTHEEIIEDIELCIDTDTETERPNYDEDADY